MIQTAKSHPEISERLLLNQLSWTNMLMRLYKTREKLAKPISGLTENKKSEIRNKISASADEVSIQNEGLLNGNSASSSFLTLNSSFDQDDVSAFSDVAALSEPAAISAPHALPPLRNEEGRRKNENPAENEKSEIRNKKSSDNEEVRSKNEERVPDSGASIEDQETESGDRDQVSGVTENKNSEKRNKKSSDNEEVLTTNHYPLTTEDDPSLDNDLPPYIQIIRNAFGRSEPNEEGRLTFTFDEIRYLASDPDFARIYPDAATDMREILLKIDSG